MSTLFDPIAQARAAGAAAIESPICNAPYGEPLCHWQVVDFESYERTEPKLVPGRRDAGYFYSPRGAKYESSKLEEEFVPLEAVNEIRRRVAQWRADGYRGVTPVTRRLLLRAGRSACPSGPWPAPGRTARRSAPSQTGASRTRT